MKRRELNQIAAGALLTCAIPARSQQINWPTKPIRILVGFPAGSTPDSSARALSDGLAKALGQPVIVENKAGASGNIATDQVAKATDDHTLGVLINGNLTSAKMLNPKLPFDPSRDFTLLSLLTVAPLALVIPAQLPDGRAFFAEAARNGDRWNYGSVGAGSIAHLGMELLKKKVPGLRAIHIPFQSNPAVITALLANEIQLALLPPGLALPHVKAAKLKIVGLTTGRSTLAPDVPSLSELGVRDYELEVWTALVGPAKLSKAAQQRLAVEVPKIMHADETRLLLYMQGWQAIGSAPQALQLRVADETAKLAKLIKDVGITE